MPDFLIRGLADMSVARSLFLAVFLFAACAFVWLLLVDVPRFIPARLRHALPMWLRVRGLRLARYAARQRVALLAWLLAPVGSPSSPSSAPKKGAHHA